MKSVSSHLSKCLIAGFVAILPVGGLVITVAWLESSISSSGLSKLPFYFPGMGLLLSVFLVYFIGLTVSTFIGKWLWSFVDSTLDRLPALGKLYLSLKQILGYGGGEDAIFFETVLVPSRDSDGEELGFVTNKMTLANGDKKWLIFIPGAPNPTSGRMVFMTPDKVRVLPIATSEALKTLVAIGKTDFKLDS